MEAQQTHRALDVDWLINGTSGETTLPSPWDEDNGFAVICVAAQRFGFLKAAQMPFSIQTT